jgi:hypothetical protein
VPSSPHVRTPVVSGVSLLTPSQPELLPNLQGDAGFFLDLEAKGEFTGERLFQQHPDIYRRCVVLCARGWGVLRVAQTLGISKNTVRVVRKREGETIDLLRDELGDRALALAGDAMEAAETVLAEVLADPKRRRKLSVRDVQSLLVASGIARDTGQLLTGGPTSRVMLAQSSPAHDDFNRYLDGLSSAAPHLMGSPTDTAGEKGDGIIVVSAETTETTPSDS